MQPVAVALYAPEQVEHAPVSASSVSCASSQTNQKLTLLKLKLERDIGLSMGSSSF